MEKQFANEKRVYMDNAATTPVDPRVLKAMLRFFSDDFGNPGSMHKEGVSAKLAVHRARTAIADFLSVLSDEIIFTGSGTEANNLAILGFAANLPKRTAVEWAFSQPHFITSVIEHPSVLNCFKALEKKGARVSYIPVTRDGIIDLNAFTMALVPETVLVSIMFANNEIGTIQPIPEVAKIIRDFRKTESYKLKAKSSESALPILCTDASQAPLYIPLDVQKLGVDMLTLDAQKVYGPKGVGLLYRKRGVKLSPILYGGSQEWGMHPGTENVPGIIGFAEALAIAGKDRKEESLRLSLLREDCIKRILEIAPLAELNGSREKRLPNNINFSFPGHESEWLVLQLDARGIAVGARSACSSAKTPGSEVVAALGKGEEYAISSIRITLGRFTTREDIDRLLGVLKDVLTKRSRSCYLV